MIEAQALDRMSDGPFDELCADIAAALEIEWARAGLLDRTADPERMVGGAKERLAAIGAVDQHAEAGPAIGHPRRRLDRQAFELSEPSRRRADLLRHRLELRAVIDGEGHQRVWPAAAASSPSGYG